MEIKAVHEVPECALVEEDYSKKSYGRLEGITLKVVSIGFSVVMQIITKSLYVNTPITVMELVYWRGVLIILFNFSYAKWIQVDLLAVPKEQYRPMWYRSVIGGINNMLMFTSTKLFPLSLNSAMSYLSPMMTATLGFFFLSETLSMYDVGSMVIAFCGVAIIIFNPYKNSDFSEYYNIKWYYYLIPLIKPFFGSVSTILMRYMGTKIHCMMAPTFLGIVMGSFSPVLMLMFLSLKELVTRYSAVVAAHLVAIGLAGAIAQILVSRSLQIEKAGRVQAFNYIRIVFTMSADVFLFGIPIHWLDLIGIAIILSTNVLLAMLKGFSVIK